MRATIQFDLRSEDDCHADRVRAYFERFIANDSVLCTKVGPVRVSIEADEPDPLEGLDGIKAWGGLPTTSGWNVDRSGKVR